MYSTVTVDDVFARIVRHAYGTHMMKLTGQSVLRTEIRPVIVV